MTTETTSFDGSWFLTGPTASGKTTVAIELAERLGGEIVSVDSMALYRGMDIGTAKPTAAERARVPHHLIDICDPDEESSVAQYRERALRVAAEIRGRGRTVLFVGGSPLYLKALLRGLFEGPAADWELRRQITLWAREREPGELHARLAAVDPVSASRLHRNDTRRLIRALEVFESTGRPISESQTQFAAPRDSGGIPAFVLVWPRAELGRRIDARVDAMFAEGLVDETRKLLSAEKPLGRTARQAVGYREVIAHLEQRVPLQETIALVKTKTRQFAKRQLTWFRQLPELAEVPLDHPFDPAAVAARVAEAGAKLLARP